MEHVTCRVRKIAKTLIYRLVLIVETEILPKSEAAQFLVISNGIALLPKP